MTPDFKFLTIKRTDDEKHLIVEFEVRHRANFEPHVLTSVIAVPMGEDWNDKAFTGSGNGWT